MEVLKYMKIMDLLESTLGEDFQPIEERVRMTTIRRSRMSKIRAAAGRKSLSIAKKKNDATLRRYQRLRSLMMAQKKKLMKKYKRMALSQARRSM